MNVNNDNDFNTKGDPQTSLEPIFFITWFKLRKRSTFNEIKYYHYYHYYCKTISPILKMALGTSGYTCESY